MADQKPKKQTEQSELEIRVDNLERALSKIATLSGNANSLREFDLEPWYPSKKDMKKNRG